ncbi:siderophore ABC transporter substrate-binding protein [Shimia sp. R11_0]|uniref:siderophore ABC transporter substrate-binding protein n=1 Tax=Shimia sp. R11_0 TaxID=2821096 RepID=UPI001ADD3F5E|nr:siderophore ABC transporter substrate-binding protein [Shimia sp. R11_0]MBO9479424.1 siderophore ABC transporter substrate-binding protein [Shimia sp. R11_0]
MFQKFAAALLLSTSMAHAAEIETFAGPVSTPDNPSTIAVLDIAAVDTLTALGVSIEGVPANVYVDYLKEPTKDAAPIGSLFEPDFEAIHALQPDLVIVGGRSSRQRAAVSELAPTIDMTIWEDTVGQGLDRLKAYGDLFGKEEQAAQLRTDFEAKLAETKAALDGQGKALIVLTNGPKVSAYGSEGRFGWLHSALDLPEAVQQVEKATHGEAVSFEFIRDANPDILIVLDRLAAIGQPGESAATTLDNPLVAETNAWKNGKVIYLNSGDIYIAGGGIQSMTRSLDLILEAMNQG